MPQPAWPTEAEVGAIMVSSGLASVAPDDDDITPYLNAAIAEWERQTGFRPWLQEDDAASYYYDGPGSTGILDLRAGFCTVTAIATGITYDDDTGTALTANRDYILEPLGAREADRPFTQVRFLVSWTNRPRSIKVTGIKGFDDEIADGVWLAVAREAARLAVEDLTESGGDVDRVKQGQVEIEYSSESGSMLAKWGKSFQMLAASYARMVV